MADEIQNAEKKPLEIAVPTEVAVQVKVMEYDKLIADAEANVASLKQQKMSFILDTTIRNIQNQYQTSNK
jgi:cell division septum initiation protein DivIVA